MTNPTAVILAGGIGKRFAPLTVDKTLLPMMGKPVLQHTLEMVERSGIKKAMVVANSQNQAWLERYQSKLEIQLFLQRKAGGMGEAVQLIKSAVNGPILVINATDFVADSLIASILKKTDSAEVILTGQVQPTYFDGGYLKTQGKKVTGIVEKPGAGNQPSDLVKLVFDYFKNPSIFLEKVTQVKTDRDDHYEVALDELIKEGSVEYVRYRDDWQALKQPHMILDLVQQMLQHQLKPARAKSATIHPSASIQGKVCIGENVVIHSGAAIVGPCYIGDNCVIGNHTLVRESMIEADSVIGFGSEVARSYVGPNCHLHHNFIGDSVLESNVNPSWGTVTANWRLDQKAVTVNYPSGRLKIERTKLGAIFGQDVFCGINCSIMPGTCFESGSRILPNTIIKGLVKK